MSEKYEQEYYMAKAALLKIYGEVQGVFYRAHSAERARELGLCGWVCNMPDGSVEMCLQGDPETIQEMIDWCYEGAPASQVEDIEVDWGESGEKFESFEIRY